MIPNGLNTLLGIALVYCAILAPGTLHQTIWPLFAGGVGIVVFATWARVTDQLKWFNLVNAVLGAALIVLGIAHTMTNVPQLITFWWVFWVGCVVAVLAFWSAMYTCDHSRVKSST